MKLLIIDDDAPLLRLLRKSLQDDYAISAAKNGRDGILCGLTQSFDLILLDLQLPDIDGRTVCDELRKEGIVAPILVLSGKDAVASKIVMLDCGADDYLTKPFSMAELNARIRALLRRKQHPLLPKNELTAGLLRLNVLTKLAHVSNRPVKLTKTEFFLLEYLLRNVNVVVDKYALMEQIWENSDAINPNTVDVHVSNIRRKIGKPYGSSLIRTVHRTGYKLVPVEAGDV